MTSRLAERLLLRLDILSAMHATGAIHHSDTVHGQLTVKLAP
jgi:hypothetical protein